MKKVILITGISSGFGKAAAYLLAEKGHTVYGTVRTDPQPDSLVNYLIMDLTDPGSIKSVVSKVIDKEGHIDVLVNNAGMHTGGPAETTPVENITLQIDTNFIGLVRMVQEILPHMRRQGYGTIINFSSIGGLMGLPYQSFYSASKFAIEGFSEALRMEVNKYNIKIILINPGDFRTNNSANRRNYLAPTGEDDPYKEQYELTLKVMEKDEANGWKPEVLAHKMAKIIDCRNPRHRYIIGSFEQKLAVFIKTILPGKLFRLILQDHYEIK